MPEHIHWDVWLGPAPMRPYAKLLSRFTWRGWWDFGTGALGDMACHAFNMAFMALDLRDPTSVKAETSGHIHDSLPKESIITYDSRQRQEAAVKLVWYDGGKRPPD